MSGFKEIFQQGLFKDPLEKPSASVSSASLRHTLSLRFDAKDTIAQTSYSGANDPWLGALCSLIQGMSLNEASDLKWAHLEKAFGEDQSFWDYKAEEEEHVFMEAFELLKATVDTYRGRDYLYSDQSPLICRCFGVRESDVLEFLQTGEEVTLEALGGKSKAGMGCRSCVPQLKRWLLIHQPPSKEHFYKDRSRAEWLLEIDYMLTCFPDSEDLKMDVDSFKGSQVVISYDKDLSQAQLEMESKRLQDFLGTSVDDGLGFFLRRRRSLQR